MLNITAYGNLGRDPEIKYLDNGMTVANFSIACKTGPEETTWMNCAVWGKRAQVAVDYLKKGSAIAVSGRGKLRTYDKKDGGQGQVLEVDVQDFTLPARQQSGTSTTSEEPVF